MTLDLEAILNAFDRLDGAAQRVSTALPFQMTEAVAELDAARLNMRAVLGAVAIASIRATPAQEGGL